MSGKDADATTPRRPKRPNVPAMSRAFVVKAGRTKRGIRCAIWTSKVLFHDDTDRDLDSIISTRKKTFEDARRRRFEEDDEEQQQQQRDDDDGRWRKRRWREGNSVGEDTARTDGVDEREKQSAESARNREKSVFQPLDGRNEEEFNFRLKREQNIRVDFNQFHAFYRSVERVLGWRRERIWDRRRRRREGRGRRTKRIRGRYYRRRYVVS